MLTFEVLRTKFLYFKLGRFVTKIMVYDVHKWSCLELKTRLNDFPICLRFHQKNLALRHLVPMIFWQLAILSTWHFSTCYFINLPLRQFAIHQHGISSTCHYVNSLFTDMAFHQICHCINLSFHQLVILSTCHFVNLSFHQLVILSTCHFVNLSFCHFAILSFCHFVILSFCHFVI